MHGADGRKGNVAVLTAHPLPDLRSTSASQDVQQTYNTTVQNARQAYSFTKQSVQNGINALKSLWGG